MHCFTIPIIFTFFIFSCKFVNSGKIRTHSRYYISNPIKKTWHNASQDCQNRNMDLVDITSREQEEEILLVLNSRGDLSNIRLPHFWTSGSDAETEGEFYWKTTGNRFTYLNWRKGEPNNLNDALNQSENCMEVILAQTLKFRLGVVWRFTWNDDICSVEKYYICHRKTTSLMNK